MKIGVGFYSRIISLCLVIVLATVILSWALISQMVLQHESEDKATQNSYNLTTFYGIFQEKLSAFPNVFHSVFASSDSTRTITLLRGEAPLDGQQQRMLSDVLDKLCHSDYSIIGMFVERPDSAEAYGYIAATRHLYRIREHGELPNGKDIYRKTLLSPGELQAYSAESAFENCYGVTGALMGVRVVAVYSSSIFFPLQSAGRDTGVSYQVINARGEALYDNGTLPSGDGTAFSVREISDDTYGFTVRCVFTDAYAKRNTYALAAPFQRALLVLALLVSVSYIVFYVLLQRGIRRLQGEVERVGRAPAKGGSTHGRVPDEFRSIVTGINSISDVLQKNIDLRNTYAVGQQTANLYALQTSVNPHFLCNALQMIYACLIAENTDDADGMVLLLSRIYRSQIHREPFAPIFEEIEGCKVMWEFYELRYQGFEYRVDIDPELYPYALPRNTLQPLIENYFEHGIAPSRSDNLISIRAHREGDGGRISFIVENNGFSLSEAELAAMRANLAIAPSQRTQGQRGFGLMNVNDRLQIVFGPEAALELSTPASGGFSIGFSVPALEPEALQRSFAFLVAQRKEAEFDV